MKIGFSTDYYGPGGARSWIKGFSHYCMKHGHLVSYCFDDTVDIFCSVANLSSEEDLYTIKSKNIKILQRLGAIYLKYNHPNPLLIERKNNELKNLISYSDEIVYQSNFSKNVLFNSIYNGAEPDGSIIYNCADTKIFNSSIPKLKSNMDKKIILSVAYWGTPHTATSSINILFDVINHYESRDDVEFWVLGRAFTQHEEKLRNMNFKNLVRLDLLNPISHNLMPSLLRSADMILHLKAHEGCSNMIIESMYSGVPVVGINSGSLPELVQNSALLCNCSNNIDNFPDIGFGDLIAKIDTTLNNLTHYSKAMLTRSTDFTEEKTYGIYLKKLITMYNS